jgi:hypothetical protein
MRKLLAVVVLLAVAARGAAQSRISTTTAAELRAQVAPLAGDPVESWSFGPLTFEAAPVSWDRYVLATGRDGTGRRALVVLDAANGRVLSRTLFSSRAPLAISAAGERVAVRTAPNRVDLFRSKGGRLFQERSFVHADSISAPSLAGDELTLREGDELVRYALDQKEPAWRARVPGAFRGTPAVRGAHVFAVWYDKNGAAHLAWLEGTSGSVLGEVVLGHHLHEPRADDFDALEIVAHEHLVFVGLRPGLAASGGKELAWARVPFDNARLGSPVTLHALLAAPLETSAGWVAPERTRDGDTRWILVEQTAEHGDRERFVELAAPEHHAWLCASSTPAGRAGDVLYLGPCAVDARTLRVLWRRERIPAFRPVPVPGGLLVVEGDRLRCLDSELLPRTSDEAGERARALVARKERDLGEQLAQVALQALRAGDGRRAADLTQEAEALGANGRTLALLRGEAERVGGAPSAAPVKGRTATLVTQEREAREGLLEDLADAVRGATEAGEQHALLCELFRRAPEDARGLALLRQLLPQGAAPSPRDALAWCEFLELSAARPIELVLRPAPEAKPTREQTWLAAQRESWRPDVVGYQSERLLVITSGVAPDAVARTVRAGELLCDVLESVFRPTPGASGRLELLLYPSRAEYLAHSGSELGGLETVLGLTSGHFDVTAQVSRLFLPGEDENGARLLCTSIHELTHHWLATRSAFGPPRSMPSASGFWIVEAIATWAEELRLDPERGTWASVPERAASLDTLANAGAKDLFPWRAFLALSFEDYCKHETRPTCTLNLDWQLGMQAPRSPMQLFYAQGAALAHYLYEVEGGARRKLLLRAVEAYYRGAPLDVAAELRTTPEELGRRVTEWVRTVFY